MTAVGIIEGKDSNMMNIEQLKETTEGGIKCVRN